MAGTPPGFESLWDEGGDTLTEFGDTIYVLSSLGAGAYSVALGPLPTHWQEGVPLVVTAIVSDAIGNPVPGITVWLEFDGMSLDYGGPQVSDAQGRVSFTITPVLGGELVWDEEQLTWVAEWLEWGSSLYGRLGIRAVMAGGIYSQWWWIDIGPDVGAGLVEVSLGQRRRKRQIAAERPSYLDIGAIACKPGYLPARPYWQPPQPSEPRPGMAQLGQALGAMAEQQEAKLQEAAQRYLPQQAQQPPPGAPLQAP